MMFLADISALRSFTTSHFLPADTYVSREMARCYRPERLTNYGEQRLMRESNGNYRVISRNLSDCSVNRIIVEILSSNYSVKVTCAVVARSLNNF